MIDFQFHDACLILPPLSAEEHSSLRASIRQGWDPRHPILLFEKKILDGRHRYIACQEEGVTPTFTEWGGGNPFDLVRREHEARRSWESNTQKVLIVGALRQMATKWDVDRDIILQSANQARSEKAKAGKVGRAAAKTKNICETCGEAFGVPVWHCPKCDHHYGQGDTECGNCHEFSRSTDSATTKRTGHEKGARAKATSLGVDRGAVQRAEKIQKMSKQLNRPDILDGIKAGTIKAHSGLKQLEEQKKKNDLQRPVTVALPDGLIRGDFRELAAQIPDNSVELVFTDPPYDGDSVPLYGDAAEIAARILKPGGSFVAYSSHAHLPDVLNACREYLRYFWIMACVHSGGKAMMMRQGIRPGWKPMVWFVKGNRGDHRNVMSDTVTGGREKDHHEWQQAEAEAEYVIEKLTSPSGIVVDFFLGSGTTAIAAKKLGRKWIGFEINATAAEKATKRIAG